MSYRIHAMLLSGLLLASAQFAIAADAPPVRYPEGYRSWQHVKSMLIEPGHPLSGLVEGLHHIYANPKAMAGYRAGKFADGSIIVFDLLTPIAGERAMTEGARKALVVMHKNSRTYASTGGWGYEVFAGSSKTDRQVGNKAAAMCHTCHTAQAAKDYVFSSYRD